MVNKASATLHAQPATLPEFQLFIDGCYGPSTTGKTFDTDLNIAPDKG